MKRSLYIHVHRRIIPNSQKNRSSQVSINRRIDKQNVVYMYNGILFSLKKEGNSGVCYHMDDARRHYVKWKKESQKDK